MTTFVIVRENSLLHILVMNLTVIWKVSKNKDDKHLKSKFYM